MSTVWFNGATGDANSDEHTTDGSLVTVTVEGPNASSIKNIRVGPGMRLRAERSGDTIEVKWRRRYAIWQSFPSGNATFTFPNADLLYMECIDP